MLHISITFFVGTAIGIGLTAYTYYWREKTRLALRRRYNYIIHSNNHLSVIRIFTSIRRNLFENTGSISPLKYDLIRREPLGPPRPRTKPCDGDVCPICLDGYEYIAFISLYCDHKFHFNCLKKWRDQGKIECPVCREDFA